MKISGSLPFVLGLTVDTKELDKIERQFKSDGEIYEEVGRKAINKLYPELVNELERILQEYVYQKLLKTERPKKPYYRKERW